MSLLKLLKFNNYGRKQMCHLNSVCFFNVSQMPIILKSIFPSISIISLNSCKFNSTTAVNSIIPTSENNNKYITELRSLKESSGTICDKNYIEKLFCNIRKDVSTFTMVEILYILRNLKAILKLNPDLNQMQCSKQLLMTIDDECWNNRTCPDKVLLVYIGQALLAIHIDGFKQKFAKYVLSKLCEKFSEIPKKYCIICLGMLVQSSLWHFRFINLFTMEHRFNELFNELDEKEIILFLTLFNKRTYGFHQLEINDKLFNYLFSSKNELLIQRILQLFDYNYHSLDDSRIRDITNLSNQCSNIKIVLSVGRLHRKLRFIDNEQILEKLAMLYVSNINNLRLAVIEKVIHLLTYFRYNNSNVCIYKKTFDELRSENRANEVSHYPTKVLRIIAFMSNIKEYDYDILNQVLSTEYLRAVYGNNLKKIPMYVFGLNYNVLLDCLDYKGSQLDSKLCRNELLYRQTQLDKHFVRYPPPYLKVLRDIKQHVDDLFEVTDGARIRFIFPGHFIVGVVFILNNELLPQKIPDWNDLGLLKPENDLYKYYYVFPVADDDFVKYGNNAVKIRHLLKLGYNIIPISKKEWNEKVTHNQKLEYLKIKIYS